MTYTQPRDYSRLPQAFIATYDVNTRTKNRLPVKASGFGETVYLPDGREFMIELYNPKSEQILVKVKIQGKEVTEDGLILNPGQRCWLERPVNINKAFKFSTYFVDGSDETQEAIIKNGDVEISFFDEEEIKIPKVSIVEEHHHHHHHHNHHHDDWRIKTPIWYGTGTTGDPIVGMSNVTLGCAGPVGNPGPEGPRGLTFDKSVSCYSSQTLSDCGESWQSFGVMDMTPQENIPTGRIVEGATTGQSFTYATGTFKSYAFRTLKYKILPVEAIAVYADEIKYKRYCVNCGMKLKQNYKFCPKCGAENI